MDMNRKYRVAGHDFEVSFPEKVDHAHLLDSYEPFRVQECAHPAFTLEVRIGPLPELGDFKDRFNDEAPYIWLYIREDKGFNFGFSFGKDAPSSLLEFHGNHGILTIDENTPGREADSSIGNAMMLLFAYNTAVSQTLMIHASVSVKDGLGYVFLGKSGTGKSTHSRLWKENIPDVWLLNDDNPVLRVIDGKTYVYGSPWSGKTPCYKNEYVPVQAIVDLEQAPENRISRLSPIQGYAALMPSCSSMKWDRAWADAEHSTLERVIMGVGCWHLRCLPDADAAKLSYETCRPR